MSLEISGHVNSTTTIIPTPTSSEHIATEGARNYLESLELDQPQEKIKIDSKNNDLHNTDSINALHKLPLFRRKKWWHGVNCCHTVNTW